VSAGALESGAGVGGVGHRSGGNHGSSAGGGASGAYGDDGEAGVNVPVEAEAAAFKLWSLGEASGDPACLTGRGLLTASGSAALGLERDVKRALGYFEKAGQKGFMEGFYQVEGGGTFHEYARLCLCRSQFFFAHCDFFSSRRHLVTPGSAFRLRLCTGGRPTRAAGCGRVVGGAALPEGGTFAQGHHEGHCEGDGEGHDQGPGRDEGPVSLRQRRGCGCFGGQGRPGWRQAVRRGSGRRDDS